MPEEYLKNLAMYQVRKYWIHR